MKFMQFCSFLNKSRMIQYVPPPPGPFTSPIIYFNAISFPLCTFAIPQKPLDVFKGSELNIWTVYVLDEFAKPKLSLKYVF